jgi:4-amino-4-deoxy-L-arabinose transferase-like glycosyltransferase
MSLWRSEARLSVAVIVASAAVFGIALVLVPPFGVTFDEAKYLGIGYSLIEGHGPRIVFGSLFLLHGPVWPTVVVGPAVALGVDPLDVGRALNAICGVGLILLGAGLAWRIRPAAAAFAAIALLATTYLHELTRTARLDVPSATLAVAYLAVGLLATRRGSTPLAIIAGVVLAIAFLVKEIALPLAPVPILAAILHRQPWRPILRTAGWLTLSATIGLAPWFMFVAQESHRVYRLGTPGWTLLPIGLALLGLGLACVIASRFDVQTISRRTGRLDGSLRTWLVAGATVAWVVSLTLLFGRTLTTRGTALIDFQQIVGYVRYWYPYLLTTAIGAIGLVLSVPAMRAAERRPRDAYEDLWLATLCGLPLVILVVGVGEPPRNYLAQLAIGAGVGAGGWLWFFEGAVRRWPTVTALVVGGLFGSALGLVVGVFADVWLLAGAVGLVTGLVVAGVIARAIRYGRLVPGTERLPTWHAVVGLMIVSLLSASALLAVTLNVRQPTSISEDAVDTLAGWAREHVTPGSTIAFGSYLSYEMALPLRHDYTVRQVRHMLVVGDADAPDGIRVFGKPMLDDWVSIDIAPRNINEFQAFSASEFIAQLRKSGAQYWVYSTGLTTSAPTIIPALEGATGFERVAHWSFARARDEPINTYVYRVDLDRLALDTNRIVMAPDALKRMVALIDSKGAADLARRLAPQIVADPRTDATDALIGRLRQLAGQGLR